eukprot:comp17254_c0_seq1/m.28800 comp17254_c0_seq1/g.28800  ORF comp17254_c0_seq1/g.28800 comp17254_c0_seq1/m.28800 type:complete len:294 (-) comp17254_c0_seq1:36-917(-)
MAEDGEDVLFAAKNAFYLGNYSLAVQEANSARQANQEERDIIIYRAYTALGSFKMVLNGIPDSTTSPSLSAVRLHAQFLSNPSARETVLAGLEALSHVPPTVVAVHALVLLQDQQVDKALSLVARSASMNMEHMAIAACCYIRLNRIDHAQKVLASMQTKDDDHSLTQLVLAWVSAALGGKGIQESLFIFQELIEKFYATVRLLNGVAVSLILQGKYEDAEKKLMEAAALRGDDPDTLVNMLVCSEQLQRPADQIQRTLAQLRSANPENAFVLKFQSMGSWFDKLALAATMNA